MTLSLMEQVGFDQAFMFAYSLRDRTHAAHRMQDDVPEAVKARRLQQVIDTFSRTVLEKNQREEPGRYHVVLVQGTSRRSLPEKPELVGLSDTNKRCILPDIPIRCSLHAQEQVHAQKGDYVLVQVESAGRQTLQVNPICRTSLQEIGQIASSKCIFDDIDRFHNDTVSEQWT